MDIKLGFEQRSIGFYVWISNWGLILDHMFQCFNVSTFQCFMVLNLGFWLTDAVIN